jgi:hypothetical protein
MVDTPGPSTTARRSRTRRRTMSERNVRIAALGGVIGPIGFVGAWIASAATTSVPYSSVDEAISRLAAVGADTRWLKVRRSAS